MKTGHEGPSLRERQKAQTREHLLSVATTLIGEHGFNATSIDDIAKAAGASRATVYSYFETKDAILAELIHAMWEEADQMYRDFGRLDSWSRENVHGWIEDVVERWRGDYKRNRAASEVGQKNLLAQQPTYHLRYVDSLTLNRELWTKEFTFDDAQRRASMLISMIESYMGKWFMFGLQVDEAATIETLTDLWMDVLHAS